MSYFTTPASTLVFAMEILFNIIDMLFILRLYNRGYGKANISNRKHYLLAALVIVVVTCFARAILAPFRPAAWPPITVLFSFPFLICYPKNRQKKILYSIILLTVSWAWLFAYDLLTSPLEFKNIWVITSGVHCGFWGLLELVRKIDKGEKYNIPHSLWLLLTAISMASMITLGMTWYYVTQRDNPYLLTIELPMMLVFLFTNISLFAFFDRFSTLMRTEQENILLEQQLQLQNKHYEELEAVRDQIHTSQHNMKNYLQTASQLAARQECNEELIEFLRTASGEINKVEQVVSTGNPCLDSILNIKISEFHHENIKLDTIIHIPPNLNLSFEQVVGILGNLMDNAKEACQNLKYEERWVRINISYTKHTLFIRLENSAQEIKLWKNGLPISTKKEAGLHGLGLKNVRKIIAEIGTMNIESTSNSFVVRIALFDL